MGICGRLENRVHLAIKCRMWGSSSSSILPSSSGREYSSVLSRRGGGLGGLFRLVNLLVLGRLPVSGEEQASEVPKNEDSSNRNGPLPDCPVGL
ncbi:unnamed protein product [Allacma fusca]|uniref:Uncharacterized protein n=1 Tax=Allacma fusca TaxID=39272 RepID=A0A8J2LFQ9_9HEXA|nr:unnamed protein product [Allacma fusca]